MSSAQEPGGVEEDEEVVIVWIGLEEAGERERVWYATTESRQEQAYRRLSVTASSPFSIAKTAQFSIHSNTPK